MSLSIFSKNLHVQIVWEMLTLLTFIDKSLIP